MAFTSISVHRMAQLAQEKNVKLLDVRTPVEFREAHADFARNAPLGSLDPAEAASDKSEPIYVVCNSGNRSAKACQQLVDAGYSQVINVEGGMQAWDEAGLPLVRGKKAVSLERQVRIAAGFLVLLGIAGSFWNPLFLGLSAFVGAGLMFAGITDTCGMAMLLARMPWNQAPSCSIDSAASQQPSV